MFKDWDNFYLMIGSAAGALIGLLFVVVTLTTNLGRDKAQRGQQLYMTPIVFHLGVILVLSAVTAVPDLDALVTGTLVSVAALMGLAYAGFIISQIGRRKTPEPPHWSDVWCYGVIPAVVYLGLLAAAVAIGTARQFADYTIAAALVALLLSSIRNAWDLVTFLAPNVHGAEGERET
jgi:predicted permease